MSIEIIDNYLDEYTFNTIKRQLLPSGDGFLDRRIPWLLQHGISAEEHYPVEGIYFNHSFFANYAVTSNHFDILDPLFQKVDPKAFVRVLANIYPKTSEVIEHQFHKDMHFEHKGCILYLNTNNGYTQIKNDDGTITKVDSVENRILFFDPHKDHASTSCSDENYRAIIIANYF